MTKAIIVEIEQRAIGIAVVERGGFRFYAADALFRSIDDRIFRNFKELRRAAAELDAIAATGR